MTTLNMLQLFELFSTEEAAEQWFINARWPDGVRCAHCDSERVSEKTYHPHQRFYCSDCNKYFSPKTNSVMQSSKIGYQKWAIAIYLFLTHPKGVSANQLSKDLGIAVRSAWHLEHRIREAMEEDNPELFFGPVQVDETFIGGRAKSQTIERKRRLRQRPVIGMLDQATGKIIAQPIRSRTSKRLKGFVYEHTDHLAEVYTDEAAGYRGLFRSHKTVNHSRGFYGLTNGIESFWAVLKRGYVGTYHWMSPKHLRRYISEFASRQNSRPLKTEDRMKSVVKGAVGKRLRWKDLVKGKPANRK